jgi:hypothetical protein
MKDLCVETKKALNWANNALFINIWITAKMYDENYLQKKIFSNHFEETLKLKLIQILHDHDIFRNDGRTQVLATFEFG